MGDLSGFDGQKKHGKSAVAKFQRSQFQTITERNSTVEQHLYQCLFLKPRMSTIKTPQGIYDTLTNVQERKHISPRFPRIAAYNSAYITHMA